MLNEADANNVSYISVLTKTFMLTDVCKKNLVHALTHPLTQLAALKSFYYNTVTKKV